MARRSIFPRARVPRSFQFRRGMDAEGRRTYLSQGRGLPVAPFLIVGLVLFLALAVYLWVFLAVVALISALMLAHAIVITCRRERLTFDSTRRVMIWDTWCRLVRRRTEFGYEQVEVRVCKTVLLGTYSTFLKDWHGYTLVVRFPGRALALVRNEHEIRAVGWASDLKMNAGIPWSWADEVMYERRVR